MGWEIGYDTDWKRDIGYGVAAYCDHPRCTKVIDRGISYVCGGEPYGGDKGCGLYFCSAHLRFHDFIDGETRQVCFRCDDHKSPYAPKPEHVEWIAWKLTDASWAEWRLLNQAKVRKLYEEMEVMYGTRPKAHR